MTTRTHGTIVKTAANSFNTPGIIATVNRLLAETDGTGEVVELTMVGYEERAPNRLHLIGKVAYKACNCIATVPIEVDSGAFKGLEAGIAAD